MSGMGFRQILESGVFQWLWPTPHGLAIITGAAGGGGGGGGAFCMQGLNLYGAAGGDGGDGGEATKMKIGLKTYESAGGNGGGGGGGGGLIDGKPTHGASGRGCLHGSGGAGGQGAVVSPNRNQIVSNGGDGGRGFPGETRVAELTDLSVGDSIQISVGVGGRGGGGGMGYESGQAGASGIAGSVLLIPIFEEHGDA